MDMCMPAKQILGYVGGGYVWPVTPALKQMNMLYQDKLTTDKKPILGYSIPDEIPTTCFQLFELV